MNSITYRITGLMFLMIIITVILLTSLANHQMAGLFAEYLKVQHLPLSLDQQLETTMGVPETEFLASVHQSLRWVGVAIAFIGLAISYILARSITVPLRELSSAMQQLEHGNLTWRLKIRGKDEVSILAAGFNRMTTVLAENNQLRKRLLADIAHELKTPVAVIQGNLEGMLEGVIENNAKQISSLYEEAVHLNRLIRDLRDLSLAEAGQLTLEKQPTSMNQLISRVIQVLKPLSDERHIVLQSCFGTDMTLHIDVGRINQVLYNLLTNALRYTPRQGTITIETSSLIINSRQWCKISIRDTGPGIDPQDIPYVFNHFYRADQSRDRRSGGSGIGLAIVKQLVDIHGGHVEVESHLGQGSTFSVFLPL